ncbi:MAG: arylsulfatase [Candidatus Didemnitutus sp.]|nr:arylsulfatase [Candidatus Didemnitutus sp.]
MNIPISPRGRLGVALFSATVLAAMATERPNIVFIVADDMGYSDLGCYGSEIATPNLDALAADGLRFSQFYTTPKCFPSRASLLTGLYPHQTGLGRRPGKLRDCTTIAEVLRTAGYHTWMVGKWHGKDIPVTRGFEHFFGLVDGQVNHFNPGHQRPGEPVPAKDKGERTWAIDDKVFKPWTPEDPKYYSSDAFMDRALEYLGNQRDDQPFFLYVAFTAPHYPIQAWPEDIAKYRGKYLIGWDQVRANRYQRQKEMGLLTPGMNLAPRGNTRSAVVRETGEWMNRFWDGNGQILPWEQVGDHDKWDLKMSVYAAMVDRLDQNVGRLRAKLRELGKAENTLIVFLSDNGACSGTHHYGATPKDKPTSGPGPMDSFHTYDTPWADASNTPFYGYKDTTYEGGNATPFIVSWPAGLKTKPGAITAEVAHIMDLMPTALELAGAKYPAEFNGSPIPPMEGKSLAPLLVGGHRAGHEALFWEYNEDRAVRRGDWKLVAFGKDGPWELYDLARDRAETHDLATQRPELVRDLAARWEAWARRIGVDKLPAKKAMED